MATKLPDSDPLFEVGETVLLRSINQPELNGQYVITHRQPWTDIYPPEVPKTVWAYRLAGLESSNSQDLWNEKALRKLPPKGKPFDALMKDLNLPVGEPA